MQKFNANNVETRFIKNIIKNTYLPSYPVAHDGDFIVADAIYTYRNSIIRCTSSGKFLTEATVEIDCDTTLICSPDLICGVGIRQSEYEVMETFTPEKNIPGLTSNYMSNTNNYDANTHKALGKYLRWYRSYYGINLLPFYNCFNGVTTDKAYIKNNTIVDGYNDNYKVWMVPALLNKHYYIHIECDGQVTIAPTFMNTFGRIKKYDNRDSAYLDNIFDPSIKSYGNSRFTTPIECYPFSSDPSLIANSDTFYLLIQVPKNHAGSIVVLEDSSVNINQNVVVSREIFNDVTKKSFTDYATFLPIVFSSLNIMPTSEHIPYSSRLIEFLTENAITDIDDISQNVDRLQKIVGGYDAYGLPKDSWHPILKFILYSNHFRYTNSTLFKVKTPTAQDINGKTINDKNLVYSRDKDGNTISLIGLKNMRFRQVSVNKFDITGYCDKDIENTLYKYRSN